MPKHVKPQSFIVLKVNGREKCYEHSSLLAARYGYERNSFYLLLKRAEDRGHLEVVRRSTSSGGSHAYINEEDFKQYYEKYKVASVERARRWLQSRPDLHSLSTRSIARAAKSEKQSFGLTSIQAAMRLLIAGKKHRPCRVMLTDLFSQKPYLWYAGWDALITEARRFGIPYARSTIITARSRLNQARGVRYAPPGYLTVKQAAQIGGYSKNYVCTLAHDGKVGAGVFGGRRYIVAASFYAYLNNIGRTPTQDLPCEDC